MNQFMRKICNHKWQCKAGHWIGEDYDECPICQGAKMVEEIKQKQEIKKYQIKNECASCGKEFQNNEKKFKERGNFCLDCSGKCEKKLQWRKVKDSKDHWEEILTKTKMAGGKITIRKGKYKKIITTAKAQEEIQEKEEKLQRLTEEIIKKWGIDMEEDNKKFQGFKNYLWKVFQLND